MNLLMICALDIWSLRDGRGAPTLYRTLRAYGERGHCVHFVGADTGANHFAAAGRPAPPPPIPNVVFHTVAVPSLRRWLPLPGALAKADQKLRFAAAFPLLASRRAERILLSQNIDVVYGYEVHGLLAVRLLQRQFRLPTVARFQGTVMRPALDDRLAFLRKYEEVLALRTPAELYIMTDDGTQGDEVLAAVNPASQGRVRFWRNGLDLDRLHPAAPGDRKAARQTLGLADDRFVLLTASRLAAWKRVDRAIAALPALLKREPRSLLLIVGDGEERANLEALARRLGVTQAVRFEGAVPQEAVADYMRAADVFLAVADLSNVGNPLLEAMACGMAIITVDAGDTGDLIRDGETGRLLPSGEPAAISAAAAEVAADSALRARLGAGARAYAAEHLWTWEARMDAEVREVERLAGVAE